MKISCSSIAYKVFHHSPLPTNLAVLANPKKSRRGLCMIAYQTIAKPTVPADRYHDLAGVGVRQRFEIEILIRIKNTKAYAMNSPSGFVPPLAHI